MRAAGSSSRSILQVLDSYTFGTREFKCTVQFLLGSCLATSVTLWKGIASRSTLLRGHVKVGELRTQRPRANRRWNDEGRSLSRLARARRNASGRAVTLTLTRIRTKREREGTREDHIDNGDGRETRHWASCVSSPSGSCAAKQGLVGKRVTGMTRIPHCPPLGPRTRS